MFYLSPLGENFSWVDIDFGWDACSACWCNFMNFLLYSVNTKDYIDYFLNIITFAFCPSEY